MRLTPWLHQWSGLFFARRNTHRRTRYSGNSGHQHLRLLHQQRVVAAGSESLEDRIVLTTPVGNTLTSAMDVPLTSNAAWNFSGSIGDESSGDPDRADVDLFRVNLVAGQSVYVDLDAQETSSGMPLSGLDGYLRIFDSAGNELANNDDALGADPFLSYTVTTAGTF